ncbi:MAG: hypothetical protein U1E65_17935 [Myxococcota bacterium]
MDEPKQNMLVPVLAVALVLALIVIAYMAGQRAGAGSTSTELAALLAAKSAAPPPAPVEERRGVTPSPAEVQHAPSPAAGHAQPTTEGFGGEPPEEPKPAATERIERTSDGHITIKSAGSSDDDKDEISRYFAALDEIQVGGSDPDAFSKDFLAKMTTSLATGETGAMDDLIKEVDSSRVKLRAVHPPAVCEDYHQRMVTNVDDVQKLLKSMRTAIKAHDLSLLASISDQARELQTKAEELKTLEKALKSRAK